MLNSFAINSPYSKTQIMHKKSDRSSHKMLQECQKVIKQLQTQLGHALKQNDEKDQIIKIVTEQKQFYQEQCRKSNENMYPKLKQQISFNQSLINGLKQYNKQLTQKNATLEHQNGQLLQKCKQKDEILKILEGNITQVQNQKRKLENQWSQTLKCVKRKIFQIQSENNTADKYKIEKEIKKRTLSKGNNKKSIISLEKGRKDSTNFQNPSKQQSKVQEILRQIDQKLLNYDFLDMIKSKDLRNNMKENIDLESNKQNTEGYNVRLNIPKQVKNKKIPILKLSELSLKDEQNKLSYLR